MTDPMTSLKQAAASRAVEFVQSGMKIGLGTGSTSALAMRRLADLIHAGQLHHIVACATSKVTYAEAIRLGIPMTADDLPHDLDVTIDGADEVDPDLNVIKGAGGALLREKIVAQASRRVIIAVDDTKPSPRLGTFRPVPVEVMAFGAKSQARFLESIASSVSLRRGEDEQPFVTDSGNLIFDCQFGPIADARTLAAELDARAGIVGHGLFIGLVHDLIVARSTGLEHRERRG